MWWILCGGYVFASLRHDGHMQAQTQHIHEHVFYVWIIERRLLPCRCRLGSLVLRWWTFGEQHCILTYLQCNALRCGRASHNVSMPRAVTRQPCTLCVFDVWCLCDARTMMTRRTIHIKRAITRQTVVRTTYNIVYLLRVGFVPKTGVWAHSRVLRMSVAFGSCDRASQTQRSCVCLCECVCFELDANAIMYKLAHGADYNDDVENVHCMRNVRVLCSCEYRAYERADLTIFAVLSRAWWERNFAANVHARARDQDFGQEMDVCWFVNVREFTHSFCVCASHVYVHLRACSDVFVRDIAEHSMDHGFSCV